MERKFMKKKTVFNIAFSAMMIALAICFDLLGKFVIVLQMPNGGGVSLTMLPLIMITIICNYKYGLVSGIAFGVINCFLIDGYSFNLASFILDYIIAFSGLAIIGIFAKQIKEGKKKYFILGVILGLVIRLIASGFSGVINAGVWGYDAEFFESEYFCEKWFMSVYDECVYRSSDGDELLDKYLIKRVFNEVSKLNLSYNTYLS